MGVKNTRLDFLSWAALSAAIVVTASGEYQLGIHAGFSPYIAAGIPASLDIYALRAMRARRDVAAVVLAMIAVNALSHLVSTGLLPVNVPLVVAVSAIAPLVFWRVHRLAHTSVESAPAELPAMPTEAPLSVPVALIEAPDERAPKVEDERPLERVEPVGDERPNPRKRERRGRAQKPRPKSASKTVSVRRRERARELYDELGRRPEWTEIRDSLASDKLAPKTISRPTCQRIRDAIEKDEPKLAELGSDNVRALTGS